MKFVLFGLYLYISLLIGCMGTIYQRVIEHFLKDYEHFNFLFTHLSIRSG